MRNDKPNERVVAVELPMQACEIQEVPSAASASYPVISFLMYNGLLFNPATT